MSEALEAILESYKAIRKVTDDPVKLEEIDDAIEGIERYLKNNIK